MTATFSGSCIFSVNRKFIKHLFPKFLLCIAVSLAIGLFLSFLYMHKSHYTKSFVVTLALLPAVVCVVIMMVNGNVGAGVAVAGAFSLVRFRSVPGSAKEIGTIFLAMAAGLISGMGYLGYAVLFFLLVGAAMFLLNTSRFGMKKNELVSVKTTNMGSLFKLQYHITLIDTANKKEFIDALRCRNGNLNIVCCREETRESL